MILVKLTYNVHLAFESIAHNKTRAVLTSLGIVFGVASVISMLSIGRGAQEEILEQMKLLGTNNVIITPVTEQEEGVINETTGAERERQPFSPGLTLADARAIQETIPGVSYVSPEIEVETVAIRSGRRRSVKLVGVDQTYFQSGQFALAEGTWFSGAQLAEAMPVCIIGHEIKTRFFSAEPPIGARIKCGSLWLTVVGVLEQRYLAENSLQHLGIRDYNLDIYTPINTQLLRFSDRARLTEQDLRESGDGEGQSVGSGNYHQIDRLIVHVATSDHVKPVAEVISRMLERRHHGVVDYEVVIPEVLLAQERRTQAIFNVVLAAIASISLVVGGIGIMNIMLASVLERIREIGVRRSIGATRRDVIYQFLVESVAISFTGGVLGVLLGIILSLAIESSTGINTIITVSSVLLAFVVSVSVGLAFGLLPARRAASLDPVEALRHE